MIVNFCTFIGTAYGLSHNVASSIGLRCCTSFVAGAEWPLLLGVSVVPSMCSELLPEDDGATTMTIENILAGIDKSPHFHFVSHSIALSTTSTKCQRRSDLAFSASLQLLHHVKSRHPCSSISPPRTTSMREKRLL